MIVKVQRPIDGPKQLPWLVYGEGRKDMQRVMPSKRLRRMAGTDLTFYCEAKLIIGRWSLIGRVEDQGW